jgi:ABC-type nickel/cobalt efflux system permease component RcnA
MRQGLLAALLAFFGLLLGPVLAFAHPLGNFTVNRYSRLQISPTSTTVVYALDLAEIPTFQAMSFLDPSGNGQISDATKAAYAKEQLSQIIPNLHLTIGGQEVPLQSTSWDLELRPGQGNLPTLWLNATLVAATPATLTESGAAGLALAYRDDNEPDRIGWREIVIQGVNGVVVRDSTASSRDVSDELRNYPTDLLAKPLDERQASAQLVVAPAAANAGPATAAASAPPIGAPANPAEQLGGSIATRLASLVGGSSASPTAPSTAADTAPGLIGAVLGQASSLGQIVAAGKLGPTAIALAFVVAALWGAAHAFTPGHGKTIVAAYLVGSRGTARHALYLGLTVTATHTMGIYVLGALTLIAARFIVPESLYPWLALISGLAVVAVGSITLVNRTRSLARRPLDHAHHSHDYEPEHVHPPDHAHGLDHDHSHHHAQAHHHHSARAGQPALALVAADHEPSAAAPDRVGLDHALLHEHGIPHEPNHGDEHPHHHSHLPPGADGQPVTWRSLLALGVAGGILPCPSALVLFLGATALGQIGFGLALVAAFSVGLAGVLVATGIAFVYARQLLSARSPALSPRFAGLLRLAPVASATLIALVGLAMTADALGQLGLLGRL